MKEILDITLIQSNLFWEDADANLSQFDNLLSDVEETDIILLPEMFNTAKLVIPRVLTPGFEDII